MRLVRFKGSRRNTDWEGDAPENNTPFVYLLTEPGSSAPFYIGEYGKAATYNVLDRIKRHFWKSGTLARVTRNMSSFNNVVPKEFDAYIAELEGAFSDTIKRQSLEAWLIYIVCHVEKCQSEKFCVTKYSAPKEDLSERATRILKTFREVHNKQVEPTDNVMT